MASTAGLCSGPPLTSWPAAMAKLLQMAGHHTLQGSSVRRVFDLSPFWSWHIWSTGHFRGLLPSLSLGTGAESRRFRLWCPLPEVREALARGFRSWGHLCPAQPRTAGCHRGQPQGGSPLWVCTRGEGSGVWGSAWSRTMWGPGKAAPLHVHLVPEKGSALVSLTPEMWQSIHLRRG